MRRGTVLRCREHTGTLSRGKYTSLLEWRNVYQSTWHQSINPACRFGLLCFCVRCAHLGRGGPSYLPLPCPGCGASMINYIKEVRGGNEKAIVGNNFGAVYGAGVAAGDGVGGFWSQHKRRTTGHITGNPDCDLEWVGCSVLLSNSV